MSTEVSAPKKTFAEKVFGPWTIFGIFFGAGTSHLLTPQLWENAVPPQLPNPKLMVYLSGVAEIVGGLLFIFPRTRKLGGNYLVLLLLAVFPANIYMAVDPKWHGKVPGGKVALALRLPLQFLGMWWVHTLAKRTAPADSK